MVGSDEENYAKNVARNMELEQRRARIRALNDLLRKRHIGGRIVLTPGVSAMPPNAINGILEAIRIFEDFDEGDDPHEEHDFGAITIGAQHVFWKIDYYDKQLEFGSPDAADPNVTARVLTIMLASEY